MSSSDANKSNPSEQLIANLIQNEVAISVTPTYDATNTFNKLLSHAMKLQKLLFHSAVLLYTHLFLVLHRNDPNIKFISITMSISTHISFTFHF